MKNYFAFDVCVAAVIFSVFMAFAFLPPTVTQAISATVVNHRFWNSRLVVVLFLIFSTAIVLSLFFLEMYKHRKLLKVLAEMKKK